MSGRVLRKADAYGKHLFHHYDGGAVVHVHLGLYGKFTELPLPMPMPVGQVRMRMIGAQYGIGAFVLQAGNLMQTDQLLAGVVILSLFGLAVGKAINMLEAKLLHWR